ncbi:MAG: hypothetical protein ABIP46_06730 [Polaromonas sp.]
MPLPLPRRPARSLAWLLMLTLVLAQLLGFMHGVVHGPEMHALDNAHEHTHRHQAGHDLDQSLDSLDSLDSHDDHHGHDLHAAEAEHDAGWVEALFASHEADSDCRLFDQASHGSAAPALAALSLPVMLPSHVVDIPRGEALARWAALFDARAPPALPIRA